MTQSTKYVELELPSDLVAELQAPTATAAPESLEIIGRYILASWIDELKEDSPQHVGWIANLGKAGLAYPGSLIPESYRWPFEMLAEMAD